MDNWSEDYILGLICNYLDEDTSLKQNKDLLLSKLLLKSVDNDNLKKLIDGFKLVSMYDCYKDKSKVIDESHDYRLEVVYFRDENYLKIEKDDNNKENISRYKFSQSNDNFSPYLIKVETKDMLAIMFSNSTKIKDIGGLDYLLILKDNNIGELKVRLSTVYSGILNGRSFYIERTYGKLPYQIKLIFNK